MENSAPTLRFPEFQEKWSSSRLGKLGDFKGGGTPSTNNTEYWEGDMPWISSSDLKEKDIFNLNITRYLSTEAISESATKIIPKDSVLFVSRVGVGKLAVSKNELCTSQDFANLYPIRDNSYFIAYYFLSKNNLLHQYAQGTSIKGFTIGDLKSIPINLPKLSEQKKIASFLTAVDIKITQLTKKKELLEQYKKGVMQQLFSQEVRFKDENSNEFPEWEEKKLGRLTILLKDGTHGTHKDYPESEYLLLSAKNIRNGVINIDETDRRISEEDYNSIYKNYVLKENDILLSIVGTIGRVAIFRKEIKVAFQRSVAFFRFSKLNANFMYYLMSGEAFQSELKKRQVVSAQPGIYLGDLSKIPVMIPSLNEQAKIANFLSAIDDKIKAVNIQIEKTRTFKNGLLQQMFV